MRGRLHQALLRSFRIPNPDERFPARRGGGSAASPFEFGVELGAEQEPGGPATGPRERGGHPRDP